jgi:phage gp45-like
MDLKNKIKQLIKQVVCTITDKDNSTFPKNQVSANKKTSTVNRLSVYGYCYNPPEGTWGFSFNSQSHEATKFVLFNNLDKRKKGLKPGEIAIYHNQTGNYIHLKNDGGIVINSSSNISLNAENNINLSSQNLTHNGINIGDTHVHGAGLVELVNLTDSLLQPVTGETDGPKDPIIIP